MKAPPVVLVTLAGPSGEVDVAVRTDASLAEIAAIVSPVIGPLGRASPPAARPRPPADEEHAGMDLGSASEELAGTLLRSAGEELAGMVLQPSDTLGSAGVRDGDVVDLGGMDRAGRHAGKVADGLERQ
jgi:hypothetical protein